MLRNVLFLMLTVVALSNPSFSQQLPNCGFELWENAGIESEEPVAWNGVISGDLCLLCYVGASQRVFQDNIEKVSGENSLRIESKAVLGGLVFNGTITTGRVVAPGTTPSDGYSQTRQHESGFNLPFTSRPDSLVFWAKYNITDSSDSALVSFLLHGATNFQDPVKEEKKLVASCKYTFQTNGNWQRISLPFTYFSNATNPEYLLATFGSSFLAGKGNGNAKLWIDDLELIYNREQLTMDVN